MQAVPTGKLVIFAAAEPAKFDVATPIVPLSSVKLMLAASWWDHQLPDESNLRLPAKVSVSEMLVTGNDDAGRRVALALRKAIGTEAVLKDLKK